MPCVAIPSPPLPELPPGISFTPPQAPDPPGLPDNFCCKLINLPPIPPIPKIPGAQLLTTVLREAREALLAALDLQPLKCPRE